ncbi:MAG: MEDS domain-containing protein [Pseudomonadota bacterium]
MQASSEAELLNIKEAAAFLKVSEASLRRWTNSGMLACLRLGAKRERRFRLEDLNDFLENRHGTGNAVSEPSTSKQEGARNTGPAEVVLEGVAIKYGSHICTLYETPLGKFRWSVPFLQDGLRSGDCCFLVATKETQTEILDHVRQGADGVDTAIESGQLITTKGIPDGNEMCRFVERRIFEATRAGYRSFRLLGDMSWCLALGMSEQELIAYEQRFNREIGHSFPLVSVCQYDARDFSGPAILNAMKCHEDTFNYPLSRFFAS